MISKTVWWIATLVMALCMGCFSAGGPTAYYTLHAIPTDEEIGSERQATQLVIGIGPVELPEYLDRQALVTRISPNRVMVNDGHRWAGSLQSEILRVLADDLVMQTGAEQVVVFPWSHNSEPDLQLRIKILAFEGHKDGKAQMKAAWTLTPAQSHQPAVHRVTVIEENSESPGFEGLTAALGRALGRLSREMAVAVSKATP